MKQDFNTTFFVVPGRYNRQEIENRRLREHIAKIERRHTRWNHDAAVERWINIFGTAALIVVLIVIAIDVMA